MITYVTCKFHEARDKGRVVMCILFFDFQPFPQASAYKLILASNRDEFYDRPTDAAGFWNDNPNICAGWVII